MSGDTAAPKLSELPIEMLEFTISKTLGSLGSQLGGIAPRLGRLTLPGRKPIQTPDFLGNTSRGVVPHISQDNFRRNEDQLGAGVYIALEDCLSASHIHHLLAVADKVCSHRKASPKDTSSPPV
jgi:queuine tRNA-ribosyltransferase